MIFKMGNLKQVILVRTDIKMSKGKTAAQVAHGAVEAVLRSPSSLVSMWRQTGMKKITLKVKSERELYRYLQEAKDFGIATALITDAGHTEIDPGTITCLAIGPETEDKIDAITESLNNKKDTPEFAAYLRDYMLNFIVPIQRELDDLPNLEVAVGLTQDRSKGFFDAQESKIYVAGTESILNADIDMSMQQGLAHELTHAVLNHGIDNNANKVF